MIDSCHHCSSGRGFVHFLILFQGELPERRTDLLKMMGGYCVDFSQRATLTDVLERLRLSVNAIGNHVELAIPDSVFINDDLGALLVMKELFNGIISIFEKRCDRGVNPKVVLKFSSLQIYRLFERAAEKHGLIEEPVHRCQFTLVRPCSDEDLEGYIGACSAPGDVREISFLLEGTTDVVETLKLRFLRYGNFQNETSFVVRIEEGSYRGFGLRLQHAAGEAVLRSDYKPTDVDSLLREQM
jgi:hypothetical protein